MDTIVINGGATLSGTVATGGAKNAALPLLFATLLADGEYRFSNVPRLRDIDSTLLLLEHLGTRVDRSGDTLSVHAVECGHLDAPYDIVRKMRASILCLGPLLARYGRAKVSLPGGCAIGSRPVNLHLKGLEALGADVEMEHGFVIVKASKLKGGNVYLDFPSVGATETVMMAATLADGETVIENAAREPEVIDLANCLNKMGARISGAGTDTIEIEGVDSLSGTDYSVLPDRIETGTYLVAAAMTGGMPWLLNLMLTDWAPHRKQSRPSVIPAFSGSRLPV